MVPTCESNQCGALQVVEDDSACTDQVVAIADCGSYPAAACTGESEQAMPSCPDSCTAQSECVGSGIECNAQGKCCAPDTFDYDADPDCECTDSDPPDLAATCADAIDLGNVADIGQTVLASGNLIRAGQERWYRVRATDSADTSCDNFHFDVRFASNPGGAFEFRVSRGSCASVEGSVDYVNYRWATDFRAVLASRLAGQCPCTASGATRVNDVSVCENDSEDYFVRVRRTAGAPLDCSEYQLELSNGVYDTP